PATPASSIPTISPTASRRRRTTRSCPCARSTTRSRSAAAPPIERREPEPELRPAATGARPGGCYRPIGGRPTLLLYSLDIPSTSSRCLGHEFQEIRAQG